jgi:hypothetical protein
MDEIIMHNDSIDNNGWRMDEKLSSRLLAQAVALLSFH